MSTSGGSSGGGVSSFNTRTGAVVYDLADAETVYTAAGELLAGSGSGAGDLLGIGTAGQVLTVGGADPSGLEWATPSGGSLTSVESYITATVSVAANTATNVTSVSLAAGTWLVIGRMVITTSNLALMDCWLGPNSASAIGAYAGSSNSIAVGGDQVPMEVTKVVTLGSTTTVYLVTESNQAGTVENASARVTAPNVSGITAVKIG